MENEEKKQLPYEELANKYQTLFDKVLNLYLEGQLVDLYGMKEYLALYLVSNLTGIDPQRLTELREEKEKSSSKAH